MRAAAAATPPPPPLPPPPLCCLSSVKTRSEFNSNTAVLYAEQTYARPGKFWPGRTKSLLTQTTAVRHFPVLAAYKNDHQAAPRTSSLTFKQDCIQMVLMIIILGFVPIALQPRGRKEVTLFY